MAVIAWFIAICQFIVIVIWLLSKAAKIASFLWGRH